MESSIAAHNKEAAKTIYAPLQPGTIRLVNLYPASHLNADVVCSLEHVRLDGNPRYQALSYVWGSQDNPKEISLNGTTALVTQNLHSALRRLRLQDKTRVIWVDALSINQSDVAERNTEVQRMRHIYSSAYETLAWFDKSLHEGNEIILTSPAKVDYELCQDRHEILYKLNPFLHAIANQSYWRRIWTAQEVRYSQRVILVTKSREVPFDRLLRLQDVVSSLDASSMLPFRCREELGLSFPKFRSKCLTVRPLDPSDNEHLDMSSWVDICCLRTCSDQKDLVFGLWAWFPPEVKSRVKVDYSLPTAQVLGSCKKAFLDTTHTLDVLGLSNLFDDSAAAVLPSWDPELYFMSPLRAFLDLRSLPELLRLDHGRRWSQTVSSRVSEDLRILHVEGNRIGTVTMAAAKLPGDTCSNHRVFPKFIFATMESLQVKGEEAEKFSLSVRPLCVDEFTILLEEFAEVAKLLQPTNSDKKTIKDVISKLLSRHSRERNHLGPVDRNNYRHFSVTRLEADAAIETDAEESQALFGLMWYKTAKPGDEVYVVRGCSRALVLRPANGDPGKHKLVGAIFFPGPEGKENPLIDEVLTKSPVTDIILC